MKKILGLFSLVALLCAILGLVSVPATARSGGGSNSGGAETIKVSKCFYVAGNGTMLVNANSSISSAHLSLYLPSGRYIGEVQNGSGGKYGGTVFFVGADPISVTISSSAGASITVPTTPFQL